MNSKMILVALVATLAVAPHAAPQTGTMVDPRDGQKYKTVNIGKQVWMAENLNYKTQKSYCYKNNESNCSKYGRLYTWHAAQNACPRGWHLPSREEFEKLSYTVEGLSRKLKSGVDDRLRECRDCFEAGGDLNACVKCLDFKMKSDVIGWAVCRNCSDDFSFSALPAGGMNDDGSFGGGGFGASFWSSTERYSFSAYYMGLDRDMDVMIKDDGKYSGYSVRCLKD